MYTPSIPPNAAQADSTETISLAAGQSVLIVATGGSLDVNESVKVFFQTESGGTPERLNTSQFSGSSFIVGPNNANRLSGPGDFILRKSATPGRNIEVGYFS